MVRAAASSDVFTAVAEPTRRAILDRLAQGERPVNDLVEELGVAQPLISKHLRVLRDAGLVEMRRVGRRRLYRVRGGSLRTVHDWVRTFERFWAHQLEQVRTLAEQSAISPGDPTNAAGNDDS